MSDDYDRLEHEAAGTKAIVDHRARWEALPPLETVNGVARDRIEVFCRLKKITIPALAALGTRVNIDSHGGVELAWGYDNQRGAITAVKFRPIGDKRRYALTPSTFLHPIVVGDPTSFEWFVAEGETDTARLYDLVGDVAAILCLPAGALAFKREWADRIPRGATVYLCHDADEKGDQGAEKAAAFLGGNTIRLRPPIEGGDWCDWIGDRAEFIAIGDAARARQAPERPFSLPLEEFITLDRPEAEPMILDRDGRALIARRSLTLVGGLGGSGKTTFFLELALHLAAGVDYLDFEIPKPVSVLLIENEGPEEMFAEKLAHKLASFPHPLKARVAVCTADWGGFTLADSRLHERLRDELAEHEYDLVFGDPLDSLGIEGVGSPEDTRKFLDLMKQTGLHKTVAWWLNTHPRKEETKEALNEIAGAWGGKPDAVLLLRQLDDDRAQVRFPKLRWAKRGRRPAILLGFDAETETFTYLGEEGDEERDYIVEVRELLYDERWRTVKEIAAPKTSGGIGANADTVKAILETHPDEFEARTGDAAKQVGRHPSATVWQVLREVTQAPKSPESPPDFLGEGEGGDLVTQPYRSHQESGHLTPRLEGDSDPRVTSSDSDPGRDLVVGLS